MADVELPKYDVSLPAAEDAPTPEAFFVLEGAAVAMAVGKTHEGESLPAKPSLVSPVPLSMTTAGLFKYDIGCCFLAQLGGLALRAYLDLTSLMFLFETFEKGFSPLKAAESRVTVEKVLIEGVEACNREPNHEPTRAIRRSKQRPVSEFALL